jgi:hypothetical protein
MHVNCECDRKLHKIKEMRTESNEGSGEVREQFPWRHRQRTSQFDDVLQSDVPLPSLNPADIVAMQPSSFSQFLLRVPALVAELSQ